jgi:ribosomal protein L11 methyltransferase
MEAYVKCLNPNGMLFLSGFYQDDIPVIEAECNKYHLNLVETIEKNHWVALKFIN